MRHYREDCRRALARRDPLPLPPSEHVFELVLLMCDDYAARTAAAAFHPLGPPRS
jgi:hypothetical protein